MRYICYYLIIEIFGNKNTNSICENNSSINNQKNLNNFLKIYHKQNIYLRIVQSNIYLFF